MSNQQIDQYVSEQRKAGVPDDQIRQSLLAAGWQEPDVVAALGGEVAAPPAPTPQPEPVAPQTTSVRQSTPAQTPPPSQPVAPAGDSNDKAMAIIAYIIFFVPLLVKDRSRFVTFHANQGTILFITSFAGWTVLSFIPIIGWMLLPFWSLGILVLAILGIVHAANMEWKPLPVIGGFTIIKDEVAGAAAAAVPAQSQPTQQASANVAAPETTQPQSAPVQAVPGQPPVQQQKTSDSGCLKVALIVLGIIIVLMIVGALIIRSFWKNTVGGVIERIDSGEYEERFEDFSEGLENFNDTFELIGEGDLPKPDEPAAENFHCTVEGSSQPLIAVSGDEVLYNAGFSIVVYKDAMAYTSTEGICDLAGLIPFNDTVEDLEEGPCSCDWITDANSEEELQGTIEDFFWPLYHSWEQKGVTDSGKKVTCETNKPPSSTFKTSGKVCTQEEFDALSDAIE